MSIIDYIMNDLLGSDKYSIGMQDQVLQNILNSSKTTPTPTPTPTTRLISNYNSQAQASDTNDYYKGLKQIKPSGNISNLVVKSASENNISPALLAALLWQESGYQPNAKNPINNPSDRGIAQINRKAHPEITDEQAYDPNFAIPWAAKALRGNIDYFGGDYNKGIASYNVGRGGASVKGPHKFGGGPKGQQYLNNVARNLADEYIQELGLKLE